MLRVLALGVVRRVIGGISEAAGCSFKTCGSGGLSHCFSRYFRYLNRIGSFATSSLFIQTAK